MRTKKIQIRQINDIQGRSYKIYDVMYLDKWGMWRSLKCTFFSLEEAQRWFPNIPIEDTTKMEE